MNKVLHDTVNYIDITTNFKNDEITYDVRLQHFYVHDKSVYIVDGKHVKFDYSREELNIAYWINQVFGYEVILVPKVNFPKKINTPDFIINKEKWDLKTITSSSNQALYHAVYGKNKQSNNFILDLSKSKLDFNEIINQLKRIYEREDTNFVNKIIIKKNKIYKVFKRK